MEPIWHIFKIYQLKSNPFGTDEWEQAIGNYGIYKEKYLASTKILTHTVEVGQIEAYVVHNLSYAGYHRQFFAWPSLDAIIRYCAEKGYDMIVYDPHRCPTCGTELQHVVKRT